MMIKFIKQYKVTIGTLVIFVVLPCISFASEHIKLDAGRLGYLGFIMISILMTTLPLENRYWGAKEDRLDEILTKRFQEFGASLQERKQKSRELCQVKDTADPRRVGNRQRRAQVIHRIKNYSLFIGLCIVFPLTGIAVGLWQKNVGNESWGIIVTISVLAFVQIWGIIISVAIKAKREENEK